MQNKSNIKCHELPVVKIITYANELGYWRPSKKVNNEKQKRNLEQISKHFQSIQLSLKLGIVQM